MAVFSTDFSGVQVGSVPSGWAEKFETRILNPSVQAMPGATGGQVLRVERDRAQDASGDAMLFAHPGMVSDDCDITIGFSYGVEFHGFGVVVRGSDANDGDPSDRQGRLGYAIYFSSTQYLDVEFFDGYNAEYAEYLDVPSVLGQQLQSGVFYRLRVLLEADRIRVKVWEASAAEPSGWHIDMTDSRVTGAGWHGIYSRDYGWGNSPIYNVDTLHIDNMAPAPPSQIAFTTALPAVAIVGGQPPAAQLNFTTEVACAIQAQYIAPVDAVLGFTTDVPVFNVDADNPPERSITVNAASGIEIPDNDPAGVNVTFNVPGFGDIRNVGLSLNITHPRRSELVATLTSPTGTVVEAYYGPYRGHGPDVSLNDALFAIFNGESPQGNWQLNIVDSGVGNEGVVESAVLRVNYLGVQRIGFATEVPRVRVRADTGFANAPASFERELYLLRLVHDLGTINLPMSSFTVRQNDAGSAYLEAVVPDSSLFSAIAARSAGALELYFALDRAGARSESLVCRVAEFKSRLDQGGRSASAVVSGRFTPAEHTDELDVIPLSGASYFNQSDGSRVRCDFDPRVRIGSRVVLPETGVFSVARSVLTITPRTKTFEVES